MEKGTIMLVDDEEYVVNSLRRSLKREGYRILGYVDARQALEDLQEHHAEVDVIISDQRMPGMSGMEFLIKVRKKYPDIARILLTGHADMDVAIQAVNEGKLYRFLTKPWNDDELKVTLLNALRMRRLAGENKKLLTKIYQQQDYINSLETKYPGITQVKRDEDGAIILEE
jgi:two-component system probable response regulator PhcQ